MLPAFELESNESSNGHQGARITRPSLNFSSTLSLRTICVQNSRSADSLRRVFEERFSHVYNGLWQLAYDAVPKRLQMRTRLHSTQTELH